MCEISSRVIMVTLMLLLSEVISDMTEKDDSYVDECVCRIKLVILVYDWLHF